MFKNLRNVLKWVAIGTFIHLHTVYDNDNYTIWRDQMAVYIPIIWDMIKYITEIVLVLYTLFVVCKLDFKKFVLGPLAVDIPLSTPLNDASSSSKDECINPQKDNDVESKEKEHEIVDNPIAPSKPMENVETKIDIHIKQEPEKPEKPKENEHVQVSQEPKTPKVTNTVMAQCTTDNINLGVLPADEDPGYNLYEEALDKLKMSYAQLYRNRLETCGKYVRSTLAKYMEYKEVNTLMTNVQKWHNIQNELNEKIKEDAGRYSANQDIDINEYNKFISEIETIHQHSYIPDKQLASIDLFHLAWNIGQCFGWNGKSRAIFIKACFPKNLQTVTLLTVKNNLKKQGSCKIDLNDLINKDDNQIEEKVA
jgi:hypothetical protein